MVLRLWDFCPQIVPSCLSFSPEEVVDPISTCRPTLRVRLVRVRHHRRLSPFRLPRQIRHRRARVMVVDMIAAALSLRHPRIRHRLSMSVIAADENVTRLLGRVVSKNLHVQVAVTSLRIQVRIARLLIALTAVMVLHIRILVKAANRRVSENVRLSQPELARQRRLFARPHPKLREYVLEAVLVRCGHKSSSMESVRRRSNYGRQPNPEIATLVLISFF